MRFLIENKSGHQVFTDFESLKADAVNDVMWFLENGYRLQSSVYRAADFKIHRICDIKILAQHYGIDLKINSNDTDTNYLYSDDLNDEDNAALNQIYDNLCNDIKNTIRTKR